MASETKKGIGAVIIQIALAVLFAIMGLQLLGLKGSFFGTSEVARAINSMFKGTTADIVRIVVGVLFLIAGILFIARFFWEPGKMDNIIRLTILIIWICVVVIAHILPGINFTAAWLTTMSYDLLIVGGILVIRD